MSKIDPPLVAQAVSGSRLAQVRLVNHLTPVVRYKVNAHLRRQASFSGRETGQEAQDLVQEVFVALFALSGYALLAWNPARGASLRSFVALVAERSLYSIMRRARRDPFSVRLEAPDVLELQLPSTNEGCDSQFLRRDLSRRLLQALRSRLTDQGIDMFYQLFVYQLSTKEIQSAQSMSAPAVHKWRSRLLHELQQVMSRLNESKPVPCRMRRRQSHHPW